MRPNEHAGLLVSAMTNDEIEVGVVSVARRDPAQAAALRGRSSGQVLARLDGRVLPVDVGEAVSGSGAP